MPIQKHLKKFQLLDGREGRKSNRDVSETSGEIGRNRGANDKTEEK